jgi:sugar phosphate isomerase/epimerase
MARLSMNEMTTFRWSFEEDVANYRAAGFKSLGVWRQKLSDFGEEKGIELLAREQLSVSNLLWAGGFTGSDGRSFRESVHDALEAIRLAAHMRASCLVVYSGGRAGHTHSHARRLLRDAFRELIPAADDFDMLLAIEPMHVGCAADWTFLTGLDDALAAIDAAESPRIKLAFDTYHLGLEPNIIERIPELVSRVAIVHLGDSKQQPDGESNRCRLGEGAIPLSEIVAAFEKSGYRGYYDVELMGEEIEAADYRELLEHSRQAFQRVIGCA